MKNPFEAIETFLNSAHIAYKQIEHAPVYTSEQASLVRGISISEGAKSLLLSADANFILCVLPGNKKLATKKIKQLTNAKNVRFATPDEVVNIMGCEVGACYPFGNLINISMYVDESMQQNEYISFNPGVHDKSIKMKWKDYEDLIKPSIVNITQE